MSTREDTQRSSLAFVRAVALGDGEARRVLVEHSDLEELAEALAELALTLMEALGDPQRHLDHCFQALDVSRGWDEFGDEENRSRPPATELPLSGAEALRLIVTREESA